MSTNRSDRRIGFIGGGNMANAIINGLISAGFARGNILVSDKCVEKLAEYKKMGLNTTIENCEVEKNCGIVILAVKPQVMDAALSDLAGDCGKIYVSIAAGVTLARIAAKLGSDKKIVRAMPNTPLMVGCGMTILCRNDNVGDDELTAIEEIFAAAGDVARLDERYINVGMAMAASSPAYVYMMIEAMADAGVKHGLPLGIAQKLAAKAVEGSGKMVLDTGISPEQLRINVCSPGGTTIEAVETLENQGFAATINSAIDACIEKGNKMDGQSE
ncbi:MAG: pyrroline-5-carboxylate reductase [Oscillospiraceae bacterium]|nr:pyrroline-5-carboxylate reductase [Oscillospiraceae bacterium]